MSIGLKGNADGSGAVQVGGSDAITISTGLNTTFAGTAAVPTGTLYPIVSGTAVASTSGTSIDFTSIPSWAKRITVMLNGVSMSGTDQVVLRLGYGATPTYLSSGYAGGNATFNGASIGGTAATTGGFYLTSSGSTQLNSGVFTLVLVTANTWAISGSCFASNVNRGLTSAGSVDVGAALTAIRFVGDTTNTFDAGSINILYE